MAEERISSIRIVRAFGAEEKERKEYSRQIEVVLDWARQDAFARSVFFSVVRGKFIMREVDHSNSSTFRSHTVMVQPAFPIAIRRRNVV